MLNLIENNVNIKLIFKKKKMTKNDYHLLMMNKIQRAFNLLQKLKSKCSICKTKNEEIENRIKTKANLLAQEYNNEISNFLWGNNSDITKILKVKNNLSQRDELIKSLLSKVATCEKHSKRLKKIKKLWNEALKINILIESWHEPKK